MEDSVQFEFSTPKVNGSGGAGTTARYANVASQNGTAIDMLATVLDAKAAKVNLKWTDINGGFRLEVAESGNRVYKIRYEFFESGTTKPVPVETISWTVFDLDKDDGRTESIQVNGIAGYTVDKKTTLLISETPPLASFTGTINLDQDDPDGNPEGAVSMLFINRSSIEVTYSVLGGSTAFFDHYGDGDFEFPDGVATALGRPIYYTFQLSNDEDIAVETDFTNTLPSPLKWDPKYVPVARITKNVTYKKLSYSNSDGMVKIEGLALPPRSTVAFTLKTQPTTHVGTVSNRATVVPSGESGFSGEPLESSSSIELVLAALPKPDPKPDPVPGPGPGPGSDDDDDGGGRGGRGYGGHGDD